MDDTGEPCVACHYDKAAAGDAQVYPIYPNPEVMLDPEKLAVDHGITIERQVCHFVVYMVGLAIYASNDNGDTYQFPLTRDGYRDALRKATEIVNGRGK